MAFDSSGNLDEVDWRLIEALQEDGRMSFAELGRRVALSPPAVAERVRRLEVAGVIRGYRPELDLAKLGLPMQAVVRVMATGRACASMSTELESLPEVLEAHRVTGSDSHICRVAVRSVEHLEEVLNRLVSFSSDSVTAIILSTPIPHRKVTRDLAEGIELRRPEARPA